MSCRQPGLLIQVGLFLYFCWSDGKVVAEQMGKLDSSTIFRVPDGPAFGTPNKMRRVIVKGWCSWRLRFLACEDVDTGEQLMLHVHKFPGGREPEELCLNPT